jgi:sugar phosphate isomerase/epimerase
MKLTQVAAQLYTVRDHCQSAAALAVSARKLRDMGYTAVQLSGVGPIPAAEIVTIMRNEGLTICATHEPSQQILDEPEKVIDQLHRLGCGLTAYPYPSGVDFADAAQVDTLVRKLDAAGAKLRAAGMKLGYHNHAIEFVKYRGAPVLEYIYAQTHPENLVGEIDTYWIHYGGGDVVEWTRKLRGRQPFIHLKDYGFTRENKPTWCEIGAGTLPFARIIAEAEAGGCEWFIVEQDTCPGDPFSSLRQSFDYIKANLVA